MSVRRKEQPWIVFPMFAALLIGLYLFAMKAKAMSVPEGTGR